MGIRGYEIAASNVVIHDTVTLDIDVVMITLWCQQDDETVKEDSPYIK